MKIARDSTKGEVMIDYAREYGIDVEVLRLEHPLQLGQVRVSRAHEGWSSEYWKVARGFGEVTALEVFALFKARLKAFDAVKAEQVLLAAAVPVPLPDWVPTFIIKCVGSVDDVVESLPDVAPAPVKRRRGQLTKEMRQGAYTFTAAQLLQADIAYDRRAENPLHPNATIYGS
jgi:hypothetical protein